jgi:hypothetical protein
VVHASELRVLIIDEVASAFLFSLRPGNLSANALLSAWLLQHP